MAHEPDTVPRERTALSWSRTAIGANVVLAPMLFVTIREGFWVLAAGGAMIAVVGSVMTMLLRRRYRELRATRVDHVERRPSYSPYWALSGVTVTVTAAAIGGTLTGLALLLRS